MTQSRVLLLLAHFVLWDMAILFPQHAAAADKSSGTRVSLNLSPFIVPSIQGLYVRFGEFAQSLFFYIDRKGGGGHHNHRKTQPGKAIMTHCNAFLTKKRKSELGGVDRRCDRCVKGVYSPTERWMQVCWLSLRKKPSLQRHS